MCTPWYIQIYSRRQQFHMLIVLGCAVLNTLPRKYICWDYHTYFLCLHRHCVHEYNKTKMCVQWGYINKELGQEQIDIMSRSNNAKKRSNFPV